MNEVTIKTITAVNEPIKPYGPGSPEKESIKKEINRLKSTKIEIPIIIGGQEIKTGNTSKCVMPHDHNHILATYHNASEVEIKMAIESCLEAQNDWANTSLDKRCEIFYKMAQLLQNKYRDTINASTMLGQSKNIFQAEIDSACELIDFFKFNCQYAQEIYANQPCISPKGFKNHLEYRPLEGFVFAVTPFNFTSIAANLPSAPALMGNVSIWKPASSSVYSGYFLMQMFKEAGLPDGVINFIPGKGSIVGPNVIKNSNLAGVHFTGSTAVFQSMWKEIGNNINNYKSYPRIVGETGGKDFILAHESIDPSELVTAMIRGAFEYQGQKCSAASRCYIPKSIWKNTKEILLTEMSTIKMGDVEDFTNFVNAVIDESAFDNISSYIDYAKKSPDAEIIHGGSYDKTKGYFIQPTIIVTKDPKFMTMVEEIFGPVLTVYIYDDDWRSICKLVDSTSEYALTGAIMSKDEKAIEIGSKMLVNSAGNFYINDKPTGAVVGQQPFGGSRASGTNDKAGSYLNLLRWVSVRTVKETLLPPTDYRYPFMEEK
tara:strand:- start:188 stop:1819 length:1632 start_codon:yes stop_codon:yes gene_type:complete